jgi:uncharacterized protein
MFMLGDFIRVLRASDVRVSTAESIEAASVVDVLGVSDKGLLKIGLGQALAKTDVQKEVFAACFDDYFDVAEFETSDDTMDQDADDQDTDDQESNQPDTSDSLDASETSDSSEPPNQPPASLSEMLLQGDSQALAAAMAQAAASANMSEARLFTQQGLFTRRIMEAMGLAELDERLREARRDGDYDRLTKLETVRRELIENVRDYVEKQIAMRTKNAGRLVREDALSRVKLSNMDRSDMVIMRGLIQKLAKRLASMHSRRKKKSKRGTIDVRKTMRRNQSHDGMLFELVWKRVEVNKPKLIIMCDVSGSVASVARFLLMFLYSLDEVMPKTRSFAFSGQCGEISDLLDEKDAEKAMAEILMKFGSGSTDYGRSFADLADAVMDDLDKRTTLMILGDGRSNFGDPGHLILKEMSERVRRVVWLNPEGRSQWNSGDSEMTRLGAYCNSVQVCNSVRHLEKVLDDMLRLSS